MRPSHYFLLLALFCGAIFVIRITAPANIIDQDQERPSAYVLDVVKNGNWLCQRDHVGNITSKPPVWTWISAVATLICRRISLFTIYLPGALGGLGVTWLLFFFGKKYFGIRAAMFAAIMVLLTSAGSKWMGLARTDGVFTFTVTLAAILAWRAWNRGCGWTWFWVAAAISTLTKGPLGLVLAAGGLLAYFWERKSGERLPLKGHQWPGIALYFLISAGWFWLAYLQQGQALVDKMLGKELVGHVVTSKKGYFPGELIWQPPLYYLSNAAPWSLLAYFGLWRLWKHPAAATERRFERFIFCWFALGLFILSMSPHQRVDLLWPIMPAGALIAGRELARWTNRFDPIRVRYLSVIAVFLGLAAFAVFYFEIRPGDKSVRQTMAVKQMAGRFEQLVGPDFPLAHVDSPMTLQFYLNTFRPRISVEEAAERLRRPEQTFVAVKSIDTLNDVRRADAPPVFIMLPEPENFDRCPVRILSNRPDFVVTNRLAFPSGSAK